MVSTRIPLFHYRSSCSNRRLVHQIPHGRLVIAFDRFILLGVATYCAFKQTSLETFNASNSVEWPLNSPRSGEERRNEITRLGRTRGAVPNTRRAPRPPPHVRPITTGIEKGLVIAEKRASSIIPPLRPSYVGCINISFLPIKDTRNYGAFGQKHVQTLLPSRYIPLDVEERGGVGRGGCSTAARELLRLRHAVRSADQSPWHVRGREKKKGRRATRKRWNNHPPRAARKERDAVGTVVTRVSLEARVRQPGHWD